MRPTTRTINLSFELMKQLLYTWSGERIDAWLTKQFPYSRNFFQHILARKWVTVVSAKSSAALAIGLKVKKSYKLQDGDTICIESLDRFLDWGILEECPVIDLDIRLEKEDYLVLYKAKWILSHPNSVRDVEHPSVVGWLYHYFQQQDLPSMWSFIRAGLVHRLDKETDWLMIVAKSEKWLAHFKQLFQQKSEASTIQAKESIPLKKYYWARAHVTDRGAVFLKKIQNNLPYTIQEDVIPKTPHPTVKEWITKILKITHLDNEMLELDIEILTWRTHQIRYHLSTHWLPIVWDYVYWTQADIPMQLSAKRLVFKDISWETIDLSLK